MASFVRLHLLDHGAGLGVSGRKAPEMACQVGLDLPFGLGDETEAQWIAQAPGNQPEAECTREPKRIEYRRFGLERVQPLLGPGEVIGLLAGGIHESSSESGVGRGRSLSDVQGLRANLADMIHSHQGTGFTPLGSAQRNRFRKRLWNRPAPMRFGEESAECRVSGDEERIERM